MYFVNAGLLTHSMLGVVLFFFFLSLQYSWPHVGMKLFLKKNPNKNEKVWIAYHRKKIKIGENKLSVPWVGAPALRPVWLTRFF